MKTKLISINITTGTYQSLLNKIVGMSKENSTYTCIANVHMLVEAYKDSEFASIVNNADLVTADGVPLTWGLKFLYGIRQQRVAGMDLLPDLLKECEYNSIPVFFYGGTEDMPCKINSFIKSKYQNLEIAGAYSPPFHSLTIKEEKLVIERINESGAKIVFVILGCPRQEKWMASMKGKINAAMIGVGGALPVLMEMKKRAPGWMQKAGLEWFFRLCQEPRRLFKRYTITNSIFLFLIAKELLSQKFKKKNHSI